MNEWIDKIAKHISREQRLSFIVTFLLGIIVHLFMLSNKIPNPDDVGQLYGPMNRPASGRWFLFFPSAISGDLSLPWFNGVLGILYISFCTMIVIWLFQIKSSICVVAVSAVMVTFPTVASTFTYMQVGDSHFFCLLLACLAVCFVNSSSKWYWLIAIILLVLSMGIYQAYLPFTVALLVIWHIKELLIEDKDVKKILFSGIKSMCIIGISIVAYLIVTKLVLQYLDLALGDYTAGFIVEDLSIKNIGHLLLRACKRSLGFYLLNESDIHYGWINDLYILLIVIAVVFSIILFKKRDREHRWSKKILLVLLYAALPLAAGLIYCMCTQVYNRMIYGFVALPLFLVILTEWIEKSEIACGGIKEKLLRLAQLVTVLTVLLTSFNYALVSNKAYFSLYLTYEQSYAYANRLLTEIQMQDEFDQDDKIILIGTPVVDAEYTMPWRKEKDAQSLDSITASLVNAYTVSLYLRYYLGAEQEVLLVNAPKKLEALDAGIDFNELNCYPDAGSIVHKGDTIFIKFNNIQ